MANIDLLPKTPLIAPHEPPPKEVSIDPPSSSAAQEDMSNSPFAQMFRGGASKEELTKFLNNCLYVIAHECKRADAAAKRASRKFMCSITGRHYIE